MNGLNGDLSPQDTNLNDTNDNHLESTDQTIKETTLNEHKSPTSCLIINNLVRPFTLPGLKKTLSKCGKIVDDKFWINKDKSKCYVMYENETIAQESKEYINNLKWPASNPNTLDAEYGNLDELEDLIKTDKEEKIKLENERKQMEALEAAKQEERRQKLKEELSKRFNNEKMLGANLTDSNSLNFLNESKSNSNGKPTVGKDDADVEESKEKREISPPRNPHTNVLYITNLVRPFSLNQLKELLTKNGQIIEEKFWMDKIKSKCYVVYESNEDALKSRNYLHGLKWPKSNIKTLRVDFGKLSDVNDLLNINQEKPKINNDKVDKINNEIKSNQFKEDEKHLDKEENVSKEQDQQLRHETEHKAVVKEENTRSKTPAKNPISKIVYVRNLSRPFTQAQLKDLLSQDGNYDEERFWIDKIKSKCYMVYESEDVASRTRDRLHGLTWPSANHRRLVADFASESELDALINSTSLSKTDQPSKEIKAIDEHMNKDKNNRHSLNEENLNEKYIENEHDNRMAVNQRLNNNGYQSKRRRESLSPIRNKREHRDDQFDYSDARYRDGQMQPNNYEQYQPQHQDSPGKLLENLFRKTESKPSIYWIPLNDNEIKFREEKREETRKAKEMGRFRVNRYDQRYELSEFNGRKRSLPPRRDHSPYLSRNQPPPSRNYPPLQDRDRYQPYPMDKRPYRNNRPPISARNNYSPDRRYADRNRTPERNRSPERNRTPDRFLGNRGKYQETRHRVRSPRSPDRRSPPPRRSPPDNRRAPDNVDRKRVAAKESRSRSRSRSVSSNRSSEVSSSSSSSSYSSSRSGSNKSNRSNSTNSREKAARQQSRSPVRSPSRRLAMESGGRR